MNLFIEFFNPLIFYKKYEWILRGHIYNYITLKEY